MALQTVDHEISVLRVHDDGTEVEIACLVQVTLEGSPWTRWTFAGIDFELTGELPDGTTTQLSETEADQLKDRAVDIQQDTEAEIEDRDLAGAEF